MSEYLDLIMFMALVGAILLGFPVAFSIAGVAVVFAYLGWVMGVMDITLMGATGQRIFGLISNQVLIAIPLFVLMGAVLEKSRIAEELLDTMGRLFGQLRGGLGISVVLVGALLAASTGIVGATVVAMGMIALPTMLRSGYDPRVASGIVCTAGTLGQIIPPSTLLIILADVMSNAYQQAQYEQGKFAVEALSVGQFFAAAIIPGLMLVVLYLVYILVRGFLRPQDMPPATLDTPKPDRREILAAIVPPVLLIFAVLGAILGGVATPTEAAAVGAIGALLMAGIRVGKNRRLILFGTRGSRPPRNTCRPVSGPLAAQRSRVYVAGRRRPLHHSDHSRRGGDHRGALRDDPHAQSSRRGRFNAHDDRNDLRHHPGSGHVLAGLYRPGRRGAGLPYPHQHARRSRWRTVVLHGFRLRAWLLSRFCRDFGDRAAADCADTDRHGP
jgi:hypothetical protein